MVSVIGFPGMGTTYNIRMQSGPRILTVARVSIKSIEWIFFTVTSYSCTFSTNMYMSISAVRGVNDGRPPGCAACPTGMIADAAGLSCVACSGGRYADSNSGLCQVCGSGRYSSSASVTCAKCPLFKGPSSTQDACVECGENQFSIDGICTLCPRGRSSLANQTLCAPCSTGRTGECKTPAVPSTHAFTNPV